jgi:hypothetical protein
MLPECGSGDRRREIEVIVMSIIIEGIYNY